MNVKPLRTLQTALGLSGDSVDGQFSPVTRIRVKTRLQDINPATKTDRRTWPDERQAVLCLHAWGIPFNFDPDRNQIKWNDTRARFARPEYAAWWQCWDAEGWVSLGRTRNYDWMHVQAAWI